MGWHQALISVAQKVIGKAAGALATPGPTLRASAAALLREEWDKSFADELNNPQKRYPDPEPWELLPKAGLPFSYLHLTPNRASGQPLRPPSGAVRQLLLRYQRRVSYIRDTWGWGR